MKNANLAFWTIILWLLGIICVLEALVLAFITRLGMVWQGCVLLGCAGLCYAIWIRELKRDGRPRHRKPDPSPTFESDPTAAPTTTTHLVQGVRLIRERRNRADD